MSDEHGGRSDPPDSARLQPRSQGTSPPLTEMPGIDERQAAGLRRAGVQSVDDLWAQAGDSAGRRELSASTGIDPSLLARWARRADLMQIRHIGPRQAALLDLAGVSSLKQLRRREAGRLRAALLEANRTHRLLDEVPPEETLQEWIRQADAVVA